MISQTYTANWRILQLPEQEHYGSWTHCVINLVRRKLIGKLVNIAVHEFKLFQLQNWAISIFFSHRILTMLDKRLESAVLGGDCR